MTFRYDAAGNRIEKMIITAEQDTSVTRYVRDASGNVMAIYKADSLTEVPIYGSSRIGLYRGGIATGRQMLGHKQYELSNHLGNVLIVITDNVRLDVDSTWATVVSAGDCYAFGSSMPGREFSDDGYRYGFNGKEKDDDGEWGSTAYDYGFRIYNPEIGRFLSVDPLTGSYPWYSPYQFAGNNPIWAIDLDGLEPSSTVNEEIEKKPKLNLGDMETIFREAKIRQAAIDYVVKDLFPDMVTGGENYASVYRVVSDNVIVIHEQDRIYILPKMQEGVDVAQLIREHGPEAVGHLNSSLEFFDAHFPNRINKNVLKVVKNTNKIVNPLEILKVHPVIDVALTVLEPTPLGEIDNTDAMYEDFTKTALKEKFNPQDQHEEIEADQTNDTFDINEVQRKRSQIRSDNTDIEKREGTVVESVKK